MNENNKGRQKFTQDNVEAYYRMTSHITLGMFNTYGRAMLSDMSAES